MPETPSTDSSTGKFVGINNMVKGQSYNIDQVVTDRNLSWKPYEIYGEDLDDDLTITVKYGSFGSSTNDLTIKNFGWASANKYSGTFEFTGDVSAEKFNIIYFKNNKFLASEVVDNERVINNIKYGMFGDQFNTPSNFANADKIGIAKRGGDEILIIDKPNSMANLDIYNK